MKRICQVCLTDVVRKGSDDKLIWYACKCGAKNFTKHKPKKRK